MAGGGISSTSGLLLSDAMLAADWAREIDRGIALGALTGAAADGVGVPLYSPVVMRVY